MNGAATFSDKRRLVWKSITLGPVQSIETLRRLDQSVAFTSTVFARRRFRDQDLFIIIVE